MYYLWSEINGAYYGGHPINRENCLLFCKTLPLIGVYYFHLKGKHLVSLQNKFYRI